MKLPFFLRYPKWGWWVVHAVLIAGVYAAGHLLWP
jgi:hypothetical protein